MKDGDDSSAGRGRFAVSTRPLAMRARHASGLASTASPQATANAVRGRVQEGVPP